MITYLNLSNNYHNQYRYGEKYKPEIEEFPDLTLEVLDVNANDVKNEESDDFGKSLTKLY